MATWIGASANDGIGSVGVNWFISMMPVRFWNRVDALDYTRMASALDYAVGQGAPLSVVYGGNNTYSQAMFDSIERARVADHLVIAPSGNDARDNDAIPRYPASFSNDNVIAATSVNEFNAIDAAWNYGATSVDLAAITNTGGGTSLGAARTAGVAALVKSAHPEWTSTQIKDQILVTVDPLPALSGKTVTGGRLNAARAVGYLPPPTKFYVVNDGSPDRTYEYGSTGASVENYALNSGNTAPRGAASNAAGDKVWVVDANKKVYVYGTSGNLLGSWTAGSLASNADVQGVATNGTDIWIVDSRQDRVYRYAGAATRLSGSQSAASSFSLNSGNKDATDLVTDGTSIWVLNNTSSTDKVFKYTASGSLLGSWTITSAGGSPTGITLDPSSVNHLWIVDSSSDRIYQFNSATSRTSGSQSPATSFALASGNTNPQGLADPPVNVGRSGPDRPAPRVSSTSGSAQHHDLALVAFLHDLDHRSFSARKKR